MDWGAMWKKALTAPPAGFSPPTVDDLVSLCEIAPRSLAHLLDLLSMRPSQTEAEKFRNPIPKHAEFQFKGFWKSDYTRTLYTTQNCWQKGGYPTRDSDEGHGDKFRYELDVTHRKLEAADITARTPTGGEVELLRAAHSVVKGLVRRSMSKNERQSQSVRCVSMRMLHMPNVVNLDFIDALAHVSGKEDKKALFSRIPVQALIDFIWNFHAVRYHNHDLCMLLMELSVFLWLAIDQPEDELGMVAAWSLAAAFSYRMLLKEIGELVGAIRHFGSVKYYFFDFANWWQVFMVAICLAYTHQLFHFSELKDKVALIDHQQYDRALLAGASFIRWVKLMLSLSAYSFLGPQLGAITSSFWKIGGMTTVVTFYFLAFAHVFAALRIEQATTIYKVALNSIKLLLTGDGDGINFALGLGGRDENGDLVTLLWLFAAIFVFIICVLNLFIAVHGEAYGEAAEIQTENFYCNRAKVCKQVMMAPSLQCCCKIDPIKIYPFVILPGFGIWAGLVHIPALEIRYVAAAQLCAFMIFSDMVLAKAPWEVVPDKSSKVYAASEDNQPASAGDEDDGEEEQKKRRETNWYLWWYTFVKPEEDDNASEE